MPYRLPQNLTYISHLLRSFHHWKHRELVPESQDIMVRAKALYNSPTIVVSHLVSDDPVFCYANRAAQRLWRMEWDEFTKLPSRLSAEEDAQEERERLIAMAKQRGYVDDYQGVRITSDGKRFAIHDCMLFNVIDNDKNCIGQAAAFDQWTWL